MAKFYGKIGFSETCETSPGVWQEMIVERNYYGDVNRISKRWQSSSNLNDDVNINNEISILADPYALNALQSIKYIVWNNAKWKITDITVEYPRLRLSIGGVYNG